MKRFQVITAIIFFLGIAMAAQAQGGKGGKGGKEKDPKERATETVSKLKEGGLTLSDETWTKVQATYEESFTQAEAARSAGTKPDREQMEKDREAMQTKLKALMTTEEYNKLVEIEKAKGGPKGGGGQKKPH